MDASAHAHVRIRTPTCTDIHMSVCALYMLERDSHCVCVYILTVALEKARTRWGLKGERRNEGEPRKAVIADEKRARRSRRRCWRMRMHTDEKETRMKDAEDKNAGEEGDRAEGRQGGANVAKVAAV